ncbi:MAG: hypothetical protein DI585_06540 [Pseudomonas fluorescens]|nr:MAG: hypothetical protein DI585_06540 [Pseudomonas fluorescens]
MVLNPAALTLAPAQPADIPALVELAVETFGEPLREIATREFPTGLQAGTRSPLILIVAKQNDIPIGMVGLLEDYTYSSTYCLSWLAVTPAYRNQELGTALVQAAIQGATHLINSPTGSLILVTATSQQAYYHRFGFSGSTGLHGHPHGAEPHVLLSLPLTRNPS